MVVIGNTCVFPGVYHTILGENHGNQIDDRHKLIGKFYIETLGFVLSLGIDLNEKLYYHTLKALKEADSFDFVLVMYINYMH